MRTVLFGQEETMTLATPLVMIAAVLLSSGTTGSNPQKPAQPKGIAERVSEAEADIQSLYSWVFDLSARTPRRSASLDCNTGVYMNVVPSDGYLVFLVACEKIEPYLEGYKVTIAIGNPHSATFRNVSGTLGHGETWQKTLKQKTAFTMLEPLVSGSWNRMTVTLNPAAAKDVRHITFEFSYETTSMR